MDENTISSFGLLQRAATKVSRWWKDTLCGSSRWFFPWTPKQSWKEHQFKRMQDLPLL